MTAYAAGELCAQPVLGTKHLPHYAKYFSPERYEDLEILKEIDALERVGQF